VCVCVCDTTYDAYDSCRPHEARHPTETGWLPGRGPLRCEGTPPKRVRYTAHIPPVFPLATPHPARVHLRGEIGRFGPALRGGIEEVSVRPGVSHHPRSLGANSHPSRGCPARPAPRAMGSPTYAQLKSRRGAPGTQPGSRDQLEYSQVSEFAPERICSLAS
jgi:hypothetical protein